ncbi:ornithine cyclodeaminase family protein [Enterococcus rivorum]|uniref:Delta(1)-pyrroline-2-carboxylate reductase n=1 Tax=Enterococcus rivorum TaxID=762845 RepID=A0A1E5KYY4_9ENTE|nr:ornithine cyclodeaminase family protein [Enterococcus rivorum]MBP2097660.1 ornithine cyclodeaminase [Enterococcus rivorum]OEH83100.1 ornithine cyclodeaminase family protein [Enterococcus rivorum]
MLLLSQTDIVKHFSMNEAIDATKQALKTYSEGQAVVPLRTNVGVASHNGQSLFMPAYVGSDVDAFGMKIVSVYPDNVDKNLPSVPATVIVLNPATGIVDAVMDGTYLTQLRTGAVQGAATELLARKDAEIGALIGTGGQAASQLEAMLTVRNLKEVRVFSRNIEHAETFAKKMAERFDCKIFATKTCQECVENADIITTVTTSNLPTFKAEWIKPGAHINGMGSYTPDMQEMPKEILQKADAIVFDTTDGVLEEAGDFLIPLKEGSINKDNFKGELGQLILGEISGRKSETDITIFKSVGSAVLDVVAGQAIVKKAKALGFGTEIQM